MHLYTPGILDWADSQLIYHALADLGRESLCLVRPDRPYICLGFSQEPAQELDLDFCARAGLNLFRREAGGGTVLLDQRQLFFQVVLRLDNPLVCLNREVFYRRLLAPAVRVYQRTGIAARFAPINDIAVEDRKISGTGAGEIGECVVFIGNIILDFDTTLMARAVNSPGERFRKRASLLMAGGISSLKTELGPDQAAHWDFPRLAGLLIEEFGHLLGPLKKRPLDKELVRAMARRRESMLADAWLLRRGRRTKGRRLKIRSGLELVQETVATPAGQVRALYEADRGLIRNISLKAVSGPRNQEQLVFWEGRLEGAKETLLGPTLAQAEPPAAVNKSPGRPRDNR